MSFGLVDDLDLFNPVSGMNHFDVRYWLGGDFAVSAYLFDHANGGTKRIAFFEQGLTA